MLTRLVETANGPVELTEAGDGEPVLYFHGTGITGDVMVPIESPLLDDGFRLIVPNRPGYGKTPLAPHESARGCGDLMAALLDELKIERCAVMGSSGGGAFAVSFAANHPERVRSLVLLCPQLHRWDHKRWLPETSRWTLPFLKRRLLRWFLLWGYRTQLPRMGAAKYLKMEAGRRYSEVADDPVAIKLCEDTLAALDSGTRFPGFENDLLVFRDEEILPETDEIPFQAPTLVLHDLLDPLAPVEHVEWFASRVPHCEAVSLRLGGHLVWCGAEADLMHETRVKFLKK